MVAAAKAVLMAEYFGDDRKAVYYGRQLETWVEQQFFHWITKKALNELAAEDRISFGVEKLAFHVAHFYWPRRHRYPRRQIRETLGLIAEFSEPKFTRALGAQGELLADAGFARIGFRIVDQEVQEVDGVRWEESDHDLDRLIERDGIRYGVEIKNQLGYIDLSELDVKLAMCEFLGIRPMFIARMMPRTYIDRVRRAGGFSLILANQHYPLMSEDLCNRVRSALNLPVLSIRALPDTTMQRFATWHTGSI